MIGGYKVYDAKRDCTVFLAQDPEKDGFTGPVLKDVSLTATAGLHAWPDGADAPVTFLAASLVNPSQFREFGSKEPFDASQWRKVPGTWLPAANWPRYLEMVGDDGK
jgi:hypothetical protein